MGTEITSTKPSAWAGAVRKTKKIFRWMIILLVVFLGAFIYWKYFFTYSEGYRAGLLQKFSNKGALFKTYEGEMILSSVSSTSNVAIASEKFLFSVTNKDLIHMFDTLQGENVIVHYIQKNGAVFWRGDSNYLVDSIKLK
ncbi:MAG: hypothetical protein RBT38_13210 [Bacteroidales bacterium]|jgi:hypothetical protein|nr:hypothetical protein [Bacteroidales bacterium]